MLAKRATLGLAAIILAALTPHHPAAQRVCVEELNGVCLKHAAPKPAIKVNPAKRVEDRLNLSRDDKRAVQRGLKDAGAYRGGLDGLFGKGTRRAISTWQRDQGERATGYLTQLQADLLMRAAPAALTAPATAAAKPSAEAAGAPPSGSLPFKLVSNDDPKLRIYDLAAVPVGLFAVFRKSNGEIYSRVHRGFIDGAYVVESRDGRGPGGRLDATYRYDADGRRLSIKNKEGLWTYRPHSCNRTLGDCKYHMRSPRDGQEYAYTRRTEVSADGRYGYERFYQGRSVRRGSFRISDQFGIAYSYEETSSNGRRWNGELIEIVVP